MMPREDALQEQRDLLNKHEAELHEIRVQLAERDASLRVLQGRLDKALAEAAAWRAAGEALARLVALDLAGGKG